MAEVTIAFTNVDVVGLGPPVDDTFPTPITITGTLDVNYSVPGGDVIGSLVLQVPGAPTTITGFTLSNPSGFLFTLTSPSVSFPFGITGSVVFNYETETPSEFDSASVSITSPVTGTSALEFGANGLTSTLVCYVAGTFIRTPGGDVPVETLKVGDIVVTASGEVRPVKWVGHRDFDLRRHPDRAPFPSVSRRTPSARTGPRRISSSRPGTRFASISVGEVFIPVGNLVNGATIAQIEMDEVSYWHVELDSHDILIANNLPGRELSGDGQSRLLRRAPRPSSRHAGGMRADPR